MSYDASSFGKIVKSQYALLTKHKATISYSKSEALLTAREEHEIERFEILVKIRSTRKSGIQVPKISLSEIQKNSMIGFREGSRWQKNIHLIFPCIDFLRISGDSERKVSRRCKKTIKNGRVTFFRMQSLYLVYEK